MIRKYRGHIITGSKEFAIVDIEAGVDVYAITIGADSDFDECYVLPANKAIPPVPALDDIGTIVRNQPWPLSGDAIHVSVERPYIGHVQAPFRVLWPYAPYREGLLVPNRLRPYDDNLWTIAPVGNRKPGAIELDFFTCMPGWLPTKRAPLKHPYKYGQFGDTANGGIADADMLIPVMGRKDIQFAIEATALTSGGGSITFSVMGLVVLEDVGSSLQMSISETLIEDTVKSADFEESYDIDGEFDVLWIRIDETTACDCNISGYVKAWD